MGKASESATAPLPTVSDILKGSDYALTVFADAEIKALKLFDKGGKPYLKCWATDKDRPAKPEEIVRQLYIKKLIDHYGYPKDSLRIEKDVYFGSAVHEKRADIVVIEKDTADTPFIIVECKKATRKDGEEQLKSYCNAEGSPIGVWTNGGAVVAWHREEPNRFQVLPDIPKAKQSLHEMLDAPWTIDDLEDANVLVKQKTSLKDIIVSMEDLVLANAGVDAFEEVFKLIYAKLYDEWAAENLSKRKRALEFRVGRKTPREFAEVAADLFQRSTDKWKGVFAEGEKITLEPDHLCRPLESSAGVETCEYSWGHRVSMSRPPLQYRRGR